MIARDNATPLYGTITANGQNILTVQNYVLSSYTYLFNGLTSAFNGTIAIVLLDGDQLSGTWNAPTTLTWTQPAPFTGTQIVQLVITGNFYGIRVSSTAYTSGTLKCSLVAK